MSFSPAPRTDNAASIVGGLLGGLAVAGSVIAFFTLRDPRVPADTEALTELRITVAELRVQVAELKAQVAHQPPVHVAAPPPPAPPPFVLTVPQPPPPPPTPPPARALSCPGPDHCTIDRAYVTEMLANPGLGRQVRIVPAVRDGKTRGVKLYGIRPGSLPNLLGYKNGDTLLSVNGTPLTDAEAAMATYTNLRHADTLTVELERKGETLVKRCDLR